MHRRTNPSNESCEDTFWNDRYPPKTGQDKINSRIILVVYLQKNIYLFGGCYAELSYSLYSYRHMNEIGMTFLPVPTV